ncbi:PD-(D/E)XK nuclease-like domain-containing protein [Salmonella enterica subsp. enterica serovar Urbana]|nr:exonuclease VIII [Salmonella enterica]EDT0680991.1 exonuclease VIII [Salmonella enterica subsp. enterica serovar Urbana]EBU4072390.1 exonuclease VIII [Salmonella enterica]EDU0640472.1 exonuclease VIII [Salmonella enterica subsp. enterica serovar Urbana]EHM5597664.1 PD-(D/E)XK nuclease-like domain-containing protein [Salmonella enterica subsp. enterica serovar Urbana]
MSENKEDFALHCLVKNEEARKRLGIKAGFFWTTAKKLSVAVSRCIAAMDDKGYDEDDFKKPVRVNLPVVNDLPPEGVFDTEFCNRYEKGGEDGKTMMLIPGAASGGTDTEKDSNNDECQDCEVSVATLPLPQRFLHIFTYAAADKKYLHHATRAQRRHITVLEMEQENSYIQNLLMGIRDIARLEKQDNADMLRLTDAIKTVFSVTKNHQPREFKNFISAWLDTEHIDRGLLVKEWAKGNRVSAIQRTESGANAGGGNKTDRNPDYEHTLDTLDVEIAMATLPMDFNIYELPGSVYRRAKEIVKKKESPFKEWSAALRATPGILDYSRAAIFALIRSAHPEFYHYSGRLQGYINANLTETDHENPTEEALTAARHTPEKDAVEEANRQLAAARGEYVEGISDPNDPKWIHNDYSASNEGEKTEVAPEAVTRNADGTFDVSALFPPPSNQTEKTKARTERDGEMRKESNQQETAGDAVQEITADGGSGTGSDEAGETADPVENGNITVPDDIQPGIYYDIPNEAYHAGPGVSKSQLDDIADTPAIYLWRKNAPVDTEKTKSLDTGTAFHCRVLEPEEFSKRFIIAPEFNRRTSAGKEEEKTFLEECARTGRTVLTAEEGRKIELMYQSVMALPLGQWLVESAGYAESSVYWEDPETEILCRCRPDKIIPEFHWIMDVKTTADIQRFRTDYYDYRYHVQDAFYSDGYRAQFGEIPTFVFLVASTTAECGRYPVEIFMMGEDAKLAGQREYRRNLQTLAECLNNDEWPAIKTLSLPRWAKENANA